MRERSLSGDVRLRPWTLPAVGGMFAGILAIQLTADDPRAFWGVLYGIPVVLAARMGSVWGQAAGALSAVLIVAFTQFDEPDPVVWSYLAAAVTFLVVGWLAGAGAERPAGVREPDDAPRPVLDTEPSGDARRRREALKLAGLATWELDLTTSEMEWSDEYRELYGVDHDTFVASRDAFQELVHREDRQIFVGALERVMGDGTAVEIRYRIIRPSDGAERLVRSHIRCQSDSAGRPSRVVGTGQDVTDLVLVLSPRESEMLMLLAEGLSGEEIAARLVLSPATVRTHIQNAMVKLGAHTRGQAIAKALRAQEIGS
jgi:PAS domain S-box-containing protein